MIAEAVVSFVIGKLGELLVHQGAALVKVSDQVDSLKREMEWMQAFLKDAETKQNDARVKKWVADVRDISYKAEDAIDDFIFQIEQSRRRGSISYIQYVISFVGERIARQRLRKMIKEIKSELFEVGRRRKAYGIIKLSKGGEGSSSMGESLREQRKTSPLLEDTEIVGFQEDIITLVARLIEGESRRCVISVGGMGGLGKTTLTRKVYNHDDVKKHFDCCAWIYVSREYVARDLLQRIMECFLIPTGREMDETQMRESIFEHLKHKRYFVVVDDIWKTDAWDALAAAFPDMNNGSRVILTARNRDVALSYEDLPYYLKPCFLYLGVYPEDHEFSAKELIRLWVAEGFVHSEGAKTLEEVGEDYLEVLIQRSLIQIVKRSSIGGIKSCGIHDLLRDLSLLKTKEENFLNVNTESARYLCPCKARRLAMHHVNSVNASLNDFPMNIRSIIWFSSEEHGQQNQLQQNQQKLIFGGFQFLRVLHLSRRGIHRGRKGSK